jgi:hypothetical protein
MTINDAVKRVKLSAHRGDQAITTDQITTDILQCLNSAWEDLIQLLPRQAFRQDSSTNVTNIATVAGTDIYSLSGNTYPVQELIIVHYVFNNNNYNMDKIESEQEFWRKYYYQSSSQNRPYIYCPWGYDTNKIRQIRVFPIPDQVYTLQYSYYIDPTSIDFRTQSLSADIPFLPGYLQFALWRGAYYYYLKSYDDPAQGQALADYERSKLRQDMSEESDQDGNLQLRLDVLGNRYVDPVTGIRLNKY